jgi:hypothetical protein
MFVNLWVVLSWSVRNHWAQRPTKNKMVDVQKAYDAGSDKGRGWGG